MHTNQKYGAILAHLFFSETLNHRCSAPGFGMEDLREKCYHATQGALIIGMLKRNFEILLEKRI